jgi:hypothetical protein
LHPCFDYHYDDASNDSFDDDLSDLLFSEDVVVSPHVLYAHGVGLLDEV